MLIVQKYGGSSVADVARIRAVAQRVARTRARGDQVVVVVSAMGNTTHELLALAREVSATPNRRELDMLISVGERVSVALIAMALAELGVPARSLTGSQAGIITDASHANARVIEVNPERVRACLAAGEVPIVAGFQGVSADREVTTLGRGGTDTTAVVLAAALKAEECEICSDVDGIWSADPRTVPEAVKLDSLSLDEALAMARNGARILYEEAVLWAHREGITLRASATADGGKGTVVRPDRAPSVRRVAAIVADDQLALGSNADLVDLPGPCVRAAGPWGVLVDLRNVHAPMAGLERVATVAVVGTRVGAEPASLAQVLGAFESGLGGLPTRWWAGPDAVVAIVKVSEASALERHLHFSLVRDPGIPAPT